MMPACKDLCQALFDWWWKHAIEMFHKSIAETLGAKILLPGEVVEQLVSCSQGFKVIIVLNILKETGWTHENNCLQELGEPLLALIHAHFSIPQPELPANAMPEAEH